MLTTKIINGAPHVLVAWLISDMVDCCDFESGYHKNKYDLWDQKLDECSSEFIAHISEFGVLDPVYYNPNGDPWEYNHHTPYMSNGHHRVVCAWLLGIEYIPFTKDEMFSYNANSGPHAEPEQS